MRVCWEIKKKSPLPAANKAGSFTAGPLTFPLTCFPSNVAQGAEQREASGGDKSRGGADGWQPRAHKLAGWAFRELAAGRLENRASEFIHQVRQMEKAEVVAQ